jgi:hypothetical protein
VSARSRRSLLALAGASLLLAGGAADAEASATVVRVYDIEITATENAHGELGFSADVKWVERYENVRVTLVPIRAMPSLKVPASVRFQARPNGVLTLNGTYTWRGNDNSTCHATESHSVPTKSNFTGTGAPYQLAFATWQARPAPPSTGSSETCVTPGAKGGSFQLRAVRARTNAGWYPLRASDAVTGNVDHVPFDMQPTTIDHQTSTNVNIRSSTQPSASKWAFPLAQLVAGQRFAIELAGTQDLLPHLFVRDTMVIVFTPRP